jgi:hypothetical protein
MSVRCGLQSTQSEAPDITSRTACSPSRRTLARLHSRKERTGAQPPWLARPSQRSVGSKSRAFALQRLAGAWIEKERVRRRVLMFVEIEHVVQRPGVGVRRTAADAAKSEVVLDEADDRALIGEGVIDEI